MNTRLAWVVTVSSAGLRLALIVVGLVLVLGYLFFAGTEMSSVSADLQPVVGASCFIAAFLPPLSGGRFKMVWVIVGVIAVVAIGVGVNEWAKGIVSRSHMTYLFSALALGIAIAVVGPPRGHSDDSQK